MNNKTNIEEDVKIIKKYEILELGISSELSDENEITLERYNKAIENILTDRERYKNMYEAEHRIHLVRNEQLERKEIAIQKANKYDALVEKMKKKKRYFEEYDELIATSNDNYSDGTIIKRFIDTLQELIPEEE